MIAFSPEALVPTETKPPVSFWLISIALLFWGLAGASIYVAYFVETPEQFAATAETAANRQAYADYVANIPFWAIAAGIVAAIARLFGAIGLLLRRAWALHFFVISTIFFVVALYRAFILANVASVMSAPHIAVEVAFLLLSLFAIWFTHQNKGVLR